MYRKTQIIVIKIFTQPLSTISQIWVWLDGAKIEHRIIETIQMTVP